MAAAILRLIRRRRSRGYILCASPRSGSNYLCQLLASTGKLGTPREYFNLAGRRQRDDPDYPENPRDQLNRILTMGSTTNGIYGVKIHPFQMTDLKGLVDPFTELPDTRVILLGRRDLLGQAISWVRSRQTGQFRADDPTGTHASYDRTQIQEALHFIQDQVKFWPTYLRQRHLDWLDVTYEEFCQQPQHHVDRIAEHVGLTGPAPIDPAQVTVTLQRDELSWSWRERFLSDMAGADARLLASRPPVA